MKYWLMKTEPGCFSIDDLAALPEGTTSWDGVRNYQARNYLRDAVRPGDLVLFYHSNIPEPHIAGIAEVTRGGYPDHTAREPDGEHFDPKASPDNPIWYMVDVRAVTPLPRPVTLESIKGHPLLGGMPLVKRSRLSIQPVTAEEWRIIMALGGMEQETA